MKKTEFIPVCMPYLAGKEETYIIDAIRSGWISSAGQYIEKFEKEFASFCGRRFGVSTTNGTTALHLSLLSLGIGKGDEVIMPDFTMVAPLFAVLYCNAMPVFVDVEEGTWNINPELIEKKITKNTKAIMPVHIYGHPAEMNAITRIANKYGLKIIEDAAEAHGAEYFNKKCGGIGDVGCFSFFANKIITTGEGGMLVTDNGKIAENAKYFRNLCFPIDGTRNYSHGNLGYNFRLTNIQAAIGLAQLEKIDDYINMRRENAHLYNELLKCIPGIQTPIEKEGSKNVYWMYAITVDSKKFGLTRDELVIKLKERGIDTRLFFKPMHNQPFLKKFGIIDKDKYPVAGKISKTGLYLPSSSSLSKEQITFIVDTINVIYREVKKS